MNKTIIEGYKVKRVDKWNCPEGTGVPLITMPNIYRALHGIAPRTVLGRRNWDIMRKQCYADAGNKCEICGREEGVKHAHELYSTNWKKGYADFERCVCVCPKCHVYGIHSGRAITLHKRGNPLYPAYKLLDGAENVFKMVYQYNQEHPNKQLRVYVTFLEYLKCDDLRDEMKRMIEKYEVKFYMEDEKNVAPWGEWRLRIGDEEYPTPYHSQEEWQKAMDERNAKDATRQLQDPFKGGIYDELNGIIGGNNE